MDLLYSCLFGISIKIYDEIIDLKLTDNHLIIEVFKSINIMLFTLLAYNDFSTSFFVLMLSLFTNGVDDNHWRTFTIISFILCILFFKIPDNIYHLSLLIIISIIILNYEDKTISEEISYNKLISRIFVLILFLLSLYAHNMAVYTYNIESYLGDTRYIVKMLGLGIGSMIVSIGIQIYYIYFSNKNIKDLNSNQIN